MKIQCAGMGNWEKGRTKLEGTYIKHPWHWHISFLSNYWKIAFISPKEAKSRFSSASCPQNQSKSGAYTKSCRFFRIFLMTCLVLYMVHNLIISSGVEEANWSVTQLLSIILFSLSYAERKIIYLNKSSALEKWRWLLNIFWRHSEGRTSANKKPNVKPDC